MLPEMTRHLTGDETKMTLKSALLALTFAPTHS